MNRAARISHAWGLDSCLPSPSGSQVRTAPDASPPASAAGVSVSNRPALLAGDDGHPSIPSSDVMVAGQGVTPGQSAKSGQAVTLSDASAFILSLVCAHEGRPAGDILAHLIVGAAEVIGIHSLILRDAAEIDLADVPDFARQAANRFRRCGP